MPAPEDDIEFIKRRVDELVQIRAKRPWSQVPLKDEILEYVGTLPSDMNTSWRNSWRSKFEALRDAIEQITYRLVYWRLQPTLDLEAKDILDRLLKDGKINRDEWGRATWQRILRRANDGVLESVGPRPLAFFVGTVGIAALILIGAEGITEMVTEPFNLIYVLPLAIYGGLLMGIFGRLFYQFAWGHRDLAKRIRFFCPHINLRLRI